MRAIKITTGNIIAPTDVAEPLLERLQAAVGGYIQIVDRLVIGEPYVMIVNEEGKIEGLQTNALASELYGSRWHGDWIVGDAIIMRGDGDELVGLQEGEDGELLSRICAAVESAERS